MAPTVIVLSRRLGPVLPAAALPALRTASVVLADDSVPPRTRELAGALPVTAPIPAGAVVLTCEPGRAVAGAEVVAVPEPGGAALLDAVAVMDRLRSPGGCPWDAEQTHESLQKYLIEECYELYQAISDGNRAELREELGDVLLQVLFHARVAAEDAVEPFGIDDVAAELTAKLVGRHPHVFSDGEPVETAAAQEGRWDELKREEKQRESSVDGVALGQPAAALAAKLIHRTAKAGLPGELLPPPAGGAGVESAEVGAELFALAARATLAGVDPEAELRAAALRFAEAVRGTERAAVAAGLDPHALTAEDWLMHWPR